MRTNIVHFLIQNEKIKPNMKLTDDVELSAALSAGSSSSSFT